MLFDLGQAGWYDVRVRIRPAEPDEAQETFPQIAATPLLPGVLGEMRAGLRGRLNKSIAYFAGAKK